MRMTIKTVVRIRATFGITFKTNVRMIVRMAVSMVLRTIDLRFEWLQE